MAEKIKKRKNACNFGISFEHYSNVVQLEGHNNKPMM